MAFSVRKAASIEDIAEAVEGYENVIVPDRSLVEALKDRTGASVSTPLTLEFDGEYRQELFLRLAEQMSWKQASYFLQNAESCLKATAGLDGLVKKGFSSEDIEIIGEVFEEIDNPYTAKPDITGETLVVDPDRMNQAERENLPESFDSFETVSEEKKELEEFLSFRSAGELAQAVTENVSTAEPENFAIVAPEGSRHRSLIESRLEAEGMEFSRSRGLSESENLRTFIGLLRAAVSSNALRVEDVRPLVSQLEISVSRTDDSKMLSSLEGSDARDLKELLNVLQHMEFGEALEKLGEQGVATGKIGETLESLGLEDQPVNRSNLSSLEYYIRRFDPSDEEDSGVLILSPEQATFVDREHVILAGLTTEWNREPEEKPWIDEREERRKVLHEFELMLQAGENRYFMVDESEERPCFHLTELLDSSPTSFADFPVRHVSPEKTDEGKGFSKKETNIETGEVETLSQSSLNTFAQSPRLYYFDRLVPSRDEKAMKKGRLFHDFAEFYVNYPNFAEDQDCVEFMLEEIQPYVDGIEIDELRTEFRIGVRNIKRYIRREDISSREIEEYDAESGNRFAEHFGKQLRFEVTELEFKDEELGAKGKIDFVKNPVHLVDYKSGRRKTEKKVVEASKIDLYEDARFPNFQPIMYLARHRKLNPDQRLKFTFFHFLHELGDHVKGDGDLDETLVSVEYIPESFQEHIASDEVFKYLTEGVAKSNDRRKTLEKLGRETYIDFIERTEVPDTHDEEELMESKFFEDFLKLGKQEVGDYKYVQKGVKSAVRKLLKLRKSNYFRKDLDRFEDFLDEKIEELNRCKKEGFPIDADPDELPDRDLLIEKEGGKAD